MARLNLTIPDPLYERLERLRDRVNVSKVCAIALAKELDMLEGSFTPVANPKAARLVERLQKIKASMDRWFQSGYEDGENWAAELATPREIRFVLDEWDLDEDSQYKLVDVGFPESFDHKSAVMRRLNAEAQNGEPAALAGGSKVADIREVDQDAYLRGWLRAVQDLWKAAKPALRWLEEEED